MIFDDKESPELAFNDPSEFYNLIARNYARNADPGYTEFNQDKDMIDMSNPDDHPDWAKEIHEKHGVTFSGSRSPSSSGPIEQDSPSKPNIPELWNTLLKTKKLDVNDQKIPDLNTEDKRSLDLEASEEMPNRAPASDSLLSEDQVFQMSKRKDPRKVEIQDEIDKVRDTINSYISQGKNDEQIVPYYNKLGELNLQLQNLKPLTDPRFTNQQSFEPAPVKPAGLSKAVLKNIDTDLKDLGIGVEPEEVQSSFVNPFNKLSIAPLTKEKQEFFNDVLPGTPISPGNTLSKYNIAEPSEPVKTQIKPAKDDEVNKRLQQLEESEKERNEAFAKEIELKKQESEMNKRALYEAESDAAEYRKYDALFKAFNKIGAGIGGAISKVKFDVPELDNTLEKAAEQRMKDYKDRVAMEQEDPDSLYSKSFRNFAKPLLGKLNMNPMVLEGLSGKQISDIMPHLKSMYDTEVTSQYRKQIADENRANRALERERLNLERDDRKTIDRFDKANKTIIAELANSRSTFGTDARTLASTQNIRALFQGRDLNDLDSREVYEVAKSLDRVLSQTGTTISGTKALTPETARSWLGKAFEYISNKRQGAGAESFLKQFEKNLQREEATAEKRIKQVQRRALSSYADLQKKDPEKWNLMMSQHGLPQNPFEEETSVSKKSLSADEVMGRDKKTGRPVIYNKKTKQLRWAD